MNPWDRRDSETSKSYDAFQRYLALGPTRSYVKIVEQYERPASYHRQIERWSSENDWVDRALAYDEHLWEQDRQEQIEEVRLMRRRHNLLAVTAIEKAAERIKNIEPERLSVKDAIALAELGTRLERATRDPGVPAIELTQITVGPSGFDLLEALRRSPRLVDLMDEVAVSIPGFDGRTERAARQRILDAAPGE